MAFNKPGICEVCGKSRNLSVKGKCARCAMKIMTDNINQMRQRKGPQYEKWYKNITEGILKADGKVRKNPKSNR